MTDFQFAADPEQYENPEENIKGIIHTPGVNSFSSPHTLGDQAPLKPDIEGGALAGLGPPKKPVLHVGEAVPHPDMPTVMEGKTAIGGTIQYTYYGTKPFMAYEFGPNDWKSSAAHNPEDIEFPPAPGSKPVLPTLHVGEPEHVGGLTGSAKTPDGGMIFYNYHPDGKPLSAELYDAKGNFKNDELTPENITFPEFSSLKQKPEFEDIDVSGKPTLHTGDAILDSASYGIIGTTFEGKKDIIPYETKNGGSIYFNYIDGKPSSADEYDSTWNYINKYKPNEINFPRHPKADVKSGIEQNFSAPFAHYKEFDYDKPEFELTKALTKQPSIKDDWYRSETKDGIIDFAYKNGGFEPLKAVFYPKTEKGFGNPKIFTPEEINFPRHPMEQVPWTPEKPTLHIGEPVWTGSSSLEYKTSGEGNITYHYKKDGTPWFATTYKNGVLSYEITPDKVNFPAFKNSKLSISTGEIQWGPDPNSQEAHADAVVKGKSGHIFFDYANGKPKKAEFYNADGYNEYQFTPDEIDFPPHPSKPSLPKIKLGPTYEEKPIEELYKSPPEKTLIEPQSGRIIAYRDNYPVLPADFVTSHERELIAHHRFSKEIYSGKIQEYAEDIRAINNAIEKFALPEPITVARGVSSRVFKKFASVPIGKTATHSGFFQAADTKVLPHFAENWKGGEHLIVHLPAGTKAFPASTYTGISEAEYMLQTGQRFKIIAKTDRTVTLELVPRQRPIPPEENFPIDKYMIGKHLYHASPHEFNSFDFNKVGTGETMMTNPTNHSAGKFMGYAGAYLAEEPKVASKYFRDFKVKKITEIVEKQLEDPQSGFYFVPEELHSIVQEAIKIPDEDIFTRQKEIAKKEILSLKDEAMLKALSVRRDENYKQHAFVYRTLTHVDDRLLLDGDKPVSAQSPYVLSALKRAGIDVSKANDVRQILPQTHDEMMNYFNAGIQGVRFLDAHSREGKSKKPTYNYAIYDEGALDIAKKGQLNSEGKWINKHGNAED